MIMKGDGKQIDANTDIVGGYWCGYEDLYTMLHMFRDDINEYIGFNYYKIRNNSDGTLNPIDEYQCINNDYICKPIAISSNETIETTDKLPNRKKRRVG